MVDTFIDAMTNLLKPYRGGQYYLDIPGWKIKGNIPKKLFSKAIHYGHVQNLEGHWYIINVEEWNKKREREALLSQVSELGSNVPGAYAMFPLLSLLS